MSNEFMGPLTNQFDSPGLARNFHVGWTLVKVLTQPAYSLG